MWMLLLFFHEAKHVKSLFDILFSGRAGGFSVDIHSPAG